MSGQERDKTRREIARDLGELYALELFFQMQPKSIGVLRTMIAGNSPDAVELQKEFLEGKGKIVHT